jgi:hypothetical protein
MGYQVASIALKDGRRFDQVVIVEGNISQIKGMKVIPFSGEEIQDIIVTHDKWGFNADK